MTESERTKAKVPKGGRKGGTIFPRITLAQAIEYSNNVVRKTHSAPQPAETLYVGVFGNKGPGGQVRASALKQYGLLEGDVKGFSASPLAKEIQSATPEQRIALCRKAFLCSKTFAHIYTTYQGDDAVSPARLGQAAATMKVHPDSVNDCVDIFTQGIITANLGSKQGDDLKLLGSNEIGNVPVPSSDAVEDDLETEDEALTALKTEPESAPKPPGAPAVVPAAKPDGDPPPPTPKQANLHVNFTVDSSLDTDKLQKQLELLRKYGVV